MSEIASLLNGDISTITKAIDAREISPIELTRACLERAHSAGERCNVFTRLLDDRALCMAKAAEQRALAGSRLGDLDGVPITVKDLIALKGVPTTNGSLGHWQSPETTVSAPAVASLERAGAIIIGKTNLHELAMGITSVNPHYGSVKNPWDPKRSAGGSSGGSAAALALGIGFGSLGTDTGGSIRIPAAHCGIFGLKPSYGVISTAGVSPISWSLDHVGPMAASAGDLRRLYHGMLGLVSWHEPPRPRVDFRSLTIGVPRTYFNEDIEPEVANAYRSTLAALENAGVRLMEVDLPDMDDVVDTAFVLSKVEAGYAFAEKFFRYSDQLGDDVRDFLGSTAEVAATSYAGALDKQRRFRRAFNAVLSNINALAVPTTPACAKPLDIEDVVFGSNREPMFDCMIRYTCPFDVSGHPVITAPATHAFERLPVGIQFVGAVDSEAFLLDLALVYQETALSDHLAKIEEIRLRYTTKA